MIPELLAQLRDPVYLATSAMLVVVAIFNFFGQPLLGVLVGYGVVNAVNSATDVFATSVAVRESSSPSANITNKSKYQGNQ